MMLSSSTVLLLALLLFSAVKAQELLSNSNFEDAKTVNSWICRGCTGSRVSGGVGGGYAYKAAKRVAAWSGPQQTLRLTGSAAVKIGGWYQLDGYIKLIGGNVNVKYTAAVTVMYSFSVVLQLESQDLVHRVQASLPFHNTTKIRAKKEHYDVWVPQGPRLLNDANVSDGSQDYYFRIAEVASVKTNGGWKHFSARFQLIDPKKSVSAIIIYGEGPVAGVGILIDSWSMKPVTTARPQTWNAEANQRIEQIRKDKLSITVKSKGYLSDVTVEITQMNHEFGFGTAVNVYAFKNKAYRDWYMDNFEWAVLESAMKWKATERIEGQYTFNAADEVVQKLRSKGKKIRGHTVFWAGKQNNPSWVQSITDPKKMYDVCMKRADAVVKRYKGKLEHWDVNNEMVKHSFYKSVYGSDKIRHDMFKRVKQADPDVKLFLNDFSIISNQHNIASYVAMARNFLDAKVPIDGLGVQGHMEKTISGPDVINRLDAVAAVGLPIWVTELDFANSDDKKRADGLEDALTAIFSHASVKGILLWGFWDGAHWRGKDASLVNGPNMTPNAAGLMWQRLIKKQWRSDEKMSLSSLHAGASLSSSVRVFHGDYRITVKAGGKTLQSKTVSVLSGRNGARVTLNL